MNPKGITWLDVGDLVDLANAANGVGHHREIWKVLQILPLSLDLPKRALIFNCLILNLCIIGQWVGFIGRELVNGPIS